MPRRKPDPLPVDPARNLREVITTRLPALRRSDRKVGEVVLAEPARVLGLTLAETAARAAVSEPTVLRFCEAVGCGGFQDFKLRLAQSVTLGMPATHSALSAQDSPRTLADKVFDYTMNSLNWARRHLDHDALARAIDLLCRAHRIEFFGFGASGIIAADAQQKFPLFDVPCLAHCDSHQQFIAAAMMRPGDVMVAISNTGQTTSVLEAARVAVANGAAVVGISGHDSPLIGLCTVGLIVETLENTDLYTPATSRIAGLLLIDILAAGVSLRRGAAHEARLVRMKRGLTAMRTGVLHPPRGPGPLADGAAPVSPARRRTRRGAAPAAPAPGSGTGSSQAPARPPDLSGDGARSPTGTTPPPG